MPVLSPGHVQGLGAEEEEDAPQQTDHGATSFTQTAVLKHGVKRSTEDI